MHENRLILRVDGWLNQTGADELAKTCREAPRPFQLDLEGLRDEDSDGLEVLTELMDSELEIFGLHPYLELLLANHRLTTEESKWVRVLIVDDNQLGQQLMLATLEGIPDVEVVGQAVNGEQAVVLAEELEPNVILMDLSMPVMNGVEATRTILRRNPEIQIILLTGLEVGDEVLDAVRAGAMGYLAKGCQIEAISDAIRSVHEGGTYLPAAITKSLLTRWQRRQTGGPLTRREAEIVSLVAKGLKNQQIADQLCLSSATIRTHLGQIYDKLTLTNRVELTLFALRDGLASLTDWPHPEAAQITAGAEL